MSRYVKEKLRFGSGVTLKLENIEALTGLSRQKLVKVFVVIAVFLIAALFLSESFKEKKEETSPSSNSFALEDVREYEESLEKRLSSIISDIEGVGQCSVMVSLENGWESVFSQETENSAQSSESGNSVNEKKSVVIVNDDGERTVLEKQLEPKIRGVIVVCEGADNPSVSEYVTGALKAALGLSSANISVVKGGNYDKNN